MVPPVNAEQRLVPMVAPPPANAEPVERLSKDRVEMSMLAAKPASAAPSSVPMAESQAA
jgi:hypothetical protein